MKLHNAPAQQKALNYAQHEVITVSKRCRAGSFDSNLNDGIYGLPHRPPLLPCRRMCDLSGWAGGHGSHGLELPFGESHHRVEALTTWAQFGLGLDLGQEAWQA
eukprot:CAMPEP_0194757184 /NCGR_PEP_ID=MMETSP0323_2-20130528/10733_1 /TAXON_ID=2866 ORGANISM="Crypthecodinium cohnii, Strain Seligo" /NCGR_SAMPLE_ID=MMETSP0323_2 /ASSEMBLY_ACC=CAM_ASM_000346 /LENGTH=103 /DNA_ID=CAMNT_0039677015 /DNA_START=356 /DNA_END=664 /DNA_ORIENTATION=-